MYYYTWLPVGICRTYHTITFTMVNKCFKSDTHFGGISVHFCMHASSHKMQLKARSLKKVLIVLYGYFFIDPVQNVCLFNPLNLMVELLFFLSSRLHSMLWICSVCARNSFWLWNANVVLSFLSLSRSSSSELKKICMLDPL